MNTLTISLLIVIALLLAGLAYALWDRFFPSDKSEEDDDIYILIGDTDRSDRPRNDTSRTIRIPSGQQYKANTYPNDEIIIKDREIMIIGPSKHKVIKRTNRSDNVILTIKKGTQQPITKV